MGARQFTNAGLATVSRQRVALQTQIADGDLARGRIAVGVAQQVTVTQSAVGAAGVSRVNVVAGQARHLVAAAERQAGRDLEVTRGGDAHGDQAPEITYVFTNPQLQGNKLGKRLVERVDGHLRAAGFGTYYVKTLDDPDNRAIGFYEREGFAVERETRVLGVRVWCMRHPPATR